MAEEDAGLHTLKRLAQKHADDGQRQDIERSNKLATDETALDSSYWMQLSTIGAIFSIGLATTASYWGFSPPAAILTEINADIGPSNNSALFSIVWSTCCAVAILVFGRVSDKFGRRWFVIGASCLGFIGGIVACTAKNMNTLIGANVLLGLGGGVHTCYGLLTGEICPNRYKFLGIAICVIPAILPTGFGAYLSASLVHYANWRWCYYIFLMLMGPTIILQLIFYHPPNFKQLHGNTRSMREEFRRIDFVGMFLLVSGLALFLLGVSWGGEPLPWTSARILCLIIIGGLTLVVFVFWEIYSKVPNPLVPMQLFQDVRGFVCLIIIASVAGTLYISMSIIWPSQVSSIYNSSNWKSNAWLSTTIAFGIQGGIYISGATFHLIKNVRWQLLFMMSMSTAFCGALASVNSGNKGQSAAFSFLAAFPAGALELIPAILVQMDADDSDLGTVFAIVMAMRTTWGAIMTAVFVAILNNKAPQKIAAMVPRAAVAAGLPESSLTALSTAISAGTASAYSKVPGITPAIEAAVAQALSNAYAAAYAYVYYAAIAVGGVGLLAVLALRNYDHLLNTHVPRKIYAGGKGDDSSSQSDLETDQKIQVTSLPELEKSIGN